MLEHPIVVIAADGTMRMKNSGFVNRALGDLYRAKAVTTVLIADTDAKVVLVVFEDSTHVVEFRIRVDALRGDSQRWVLSVLAGEGIDLLWSGYLVLEPEKMAEHHIVATLARAEGKWSKWIYLKKRLFQYQSDWLARRSDRSASELNLERLRIGHDLPIRQVLEFRPGAVPRRRDALSLILHREDFGLNWREAIKFAIEIVLRVGFERLSRG